MEFSPEEDKDDCSYSGVDAGGDTFTVGHCNLLCTIECTLGLLEV